VTVIHRGITTRQHIFKPLPQAGSGPVDGKAPVSNPGGGAGGGGPTPTPTTTPGSQPLLMMGRVR